MVDSVLVLYGQTIAYTLYCVIIILLMLWFGLSITKGTGKLIKKGYFYSFVIFLAVLGVSLHLITYNTIPWVPTDLNRDEVKTDKVFKINVSKHQFQLPAPVLIINKNDKVLFEVSSDDLTYGFGLFRQDNSMVFQMQVIPLHRNDIIWHFDQPGVFTIRSTEYSGPKGNNMILKDVVRVVE